MSEDAPPARLAPLPRADWGDDAVDALRSAFTSAVVERFLSGDPDAPPVPTAIATMLHHPALAGPWLAYNNVLLWSPTLDERLRELMVLRVAWRTRSTYEWVQHVKLSERYGVTAADVEAVSNGTADDAWTPLERDLVAATDQLLDDYRIDDDTWSRLADQLDEQQLVEAVFVVGTYTCLAMAFKSFGLQLERGIDTGAMPLPPD
ncbi:MAG: alkylhydroperoxidase [Actinomycetia bacterium]|nr:alkylhydroperoxidase [Actinomycetes bacterium]